VINRIIFLAHWAALLLPGFLTTMLLVEITLSGLGYIDYPAVLALAIYLGMTYEAEEPAKRYIPLY